jgi:hypothetical protein
VSQSKDCLRIIDELIKCRDNDRLNLLQAELQNVLHFQCVVPSSKRSFIERYIRGEASLHIHYLLNSRILGCRYFCAMLKTAPGVGHQSPIVELMVPMDSHFGNDNMKMMVFVDSGELGQGLHCTSRSQPVVRLYALDENECSIRDSRQGFVERFTRYGKIIRNRRISIIRNIEEEGKFAVTLPSLRKGDDIVDIPLDEGEREVIEGRAKLIDNFADQKGDSGFGLASNINCAFSIRIADDFVRVCSSVTPNASIEMLDVMLCPDHF